MASIIGGYIGKLNPGDGTQYSLGSTAYGVCDTAADVAAKTVEMTGFTLITGATIFVKFVNTNSAVSPTLNVNNKGAKALVKYGTEVLNWQAGAVLCLTYDGTYWVGSSVTLKDLGLTNAMHFIGVATVAIEDGSSTDPVISGYNFTTDRKPGDVIIGASDGREYVWTISGTWELLGQDASTVYDTGDSNGAKWISRIQQDTDRNVTATFSSETIGSGIQPIWAENGVLKATTYSLNATINSGTANRMAYYSGVNAISAATNHYTSDNKLGINYTSEPTDSNLYVNGVSKFYGNTWVINTNGGSVQRFYIAKDNTINDSMSTWLDNSYTHFDIQNSGTGSNIDFKLYATDDTNNGAGANTSHVYFYGSDGESKIAADRGYFDLTANIGGVNENYNLYVNGNAKIESSPAADTPLVTFVSNTTPSTGGYQHGLHYLVPNMVENSNAAIYFGKAASVGNSACLQMNWAGNNNNNNFLGLGFYSVNNLVRIYRNGSLSIGAENNNYKLYVNGTGYISSNLTVDGSIYFGANSSGTEGKPVLAYNSGNTAFGMTYYEGTPDVITFSASGNANNKTNADFSINGLGDGILSNRGKRIPHTGNNTGNVGSATQPVYVNAGVISNTTYALGATVNSGTANRITYYSGNNAISAGNIATDGSYLDPVTNNTGHLGSAGTIWNSIHTSQVSARHLDAAAAAVNSDSALYIGWGALQPTKATKIYYSADTSSRTEFFEVNSNGSYALTRFGVNGQNTSYTLYVNGNAKIESSPAANTPLVTFVSNTTPTTGDYQHGLHYLVPNMVSDSNAALYFGKAASTGNAACLQMNWVGNNHNNNFLGLGFWAANNLLRVYKTGNVSIGEANNSYKLYVAGNTVIGNGGGLSRTQAAAAHHIVSPGGGSYTTGTSAITGALKIRLPVSWTSAMMNFTVDIYNYANNSTSSYHIGGYNFSNGSWHSIAAYSHGVGDKSNLTVRFGHDGTYCCIFIGEIDTVWSYPQINVRDVYLGYGNQNIATWSNNWQISFVTELPTIAADRTITNPSKTKDGTANRIAWYPTALSVASSSIITDGSYIRNVGGYNNTSYAFSAASAIINSWIRTVGATGWYNETYDGGWMMSDNKWIRSWHSKPVYIDIGSNNTYGIGTHRLALGLNGANHVSLMLKGGDVMYGFAVNNNGNWYFGKRTTKSFESATDDAYIFQGDANGIYPSVTITKNLGSATLCWNNIYTRALQLNRTKGATYGRISFYADTYYTWYDYMSDAANGACPTGGKPGTLGNVTSWARRSIIENAANYGWTWEATTNAAASANTVQPTTRMALSAYDGQLTLNGKMLIEYTNSWLTPSRIQIGRYSADDTLTDRAIIGVTNGNLHIDSYSGGHLYLEHYATGKNVYVGKNTAGSNQLLHVYGKMVIDPSYNTSNSHNEGMRINLGSNGWALINFGGAAASTSGTGDGQWLVGRRGTAGSSGGYGAIGDFTIEEQGSAGQGLTIHKDAGGISLFTTKAASNASVNIKNTATIAASAWAHGIKLEVPNAAAGAKILALGFGQSFATGNAGHIGFHYAGNNNTGNYLALGIWSNNDLLRIYNDGRVTVGKDGNNGSFGISNTNSATGLGISLYGGGSTGMPQYGLAFAGTATFGTFGGVTDSWATYFTTSNTSNRGWIFKRYVSTDANTIKAYNSASIRATDGVFFGGGVSLYHPNKNAWCGDFYINTIGTANSGDNNATRGTKGITLLRVGNNIAWPAAGTAGGDNNSTGIVRIYAENTYFTDIMAQTGSANRTFYLPNYNANMVAVHTGNNNAVGSATQPVYVAANGRVTACTAYASASVDTAKYLLTAAHGSIPNPTYGVNRLEYFNTSTAAGAAANTTGSPTADWYYHLRMNHANSNGYYVDIAACFHNDNIYWKRVSGGTVANSKWMHIWVEGNAVTSAVWNDYAEYRETDVIEAGRCVVEVGDDSMTISTERLQRGCSITSDTWGFAQGETEKAKTPIAVSGRVLAYPYESREEFGKHIGWPVCSGPNGTVSIMTEEEEEKYPSRIIGTISAVPDYEEWGGGTEVDRGPVKVNGRVWIRIK